MFMFYYELKVMKKKAVYATLPPWLLHNKIGKINFLIKFFYLQDNLDDYTDNIVEIRL